MINLTRRQELALINYALEHFTEHYLNGQVIDAIDYPSMKSKKKKGTHKKWSKAQHQKFSATMKKKWQEEHK